MGEPIELYCPCGRLLIEYRRETSFIQGYVVCPVCNRKKKKEATLNKYVLLIMEHLTFLKQLETLNKIENKL
jgi:hypothetical protein